MALSIPTTLREPRRRPSGLRLRSNPVTRRGRRPLRQTTRHQTTRHQTTKHQWRLRCFAVVVLGTTLAVGAPPRPTAAQTNDPEPPVAADWVPFTGTFSVSCTRTSAANPGCPVHHPTWAADFSLPTNTRVRAAGAGEVVGVYRGCAPTGGDGECNGGAGNIVVIEHVDYSSRYLHLSTIPSRIKRGRIVEAGDVIGRSGASGTFGGAHLHYDEYQVGPPSGRVAFGSMYACHDDEAVLYPDVLGYPAWDLVPPGTRIRNDNYDCSGHPPLPHPPAPEPPIYPKGPKLGWGGANAVAVGDFNGDGNPDIAIGSPGGRPDAARTGLVQIVDPETRSQTTTLAQGSTLTGLAEGGDRVGTAVVVGDFDCDGADDLAIGAPGEDLEAPFTDTGAVNIVYGDGGQQLLFSGSVIPSYYRRPSDWLGAALAVGDFDGDDCDDLAIASPGADRSGGRDMGMVWALWGSESGLGRPYRLLQGINLGGLLENDDQTGYALAAGDFDCDGRDDIAAGVPREVVHDVRGGAVMVAYGAASGFRRGEALFRGQGLPGAPAEGELVGLSLAAGDMNGDGCADLAVGAPGTTVEGRLNAGAALVVFGHQGRLSASDHQVEVRIGDGLPGRPRRGNRAGMAVAIGDVDCNGRSDLVVGAPNRDRGGVKNSGAVYVVPGRKRGLKTDSFILQQRKGLRGKPHESTRVGAAINVGDVNGDRCADLLISAPGATVDDQPQAGAVHVWFGSRKNSEADKATKFDQRWAGPADPEPKATFGGGSADSLLERALVLE